MRGGFAIVAGLSLAAFALQGVGLVDDVVAPVAASAAYGIVLVWTIAAVWRRVAERSPENLPTFFVAVSGGRLLSALAVMGGYYAATGGEAMPRFIAVFAVYYVALLVFHSVFFAERNKTK